MRTYKVTFQYADSYSNWGWRDQYCEVCANNEREAEEKAILLYGLGLDCRYHIVSVVEV